LQFIGFNHKSNYTDTNEDSDTPIKDKDDKDSLYNNQENHSNNNSISNDNTLNNPKSNDGTQNKNLDDNKSRLLKKEKEINNATKKNNYLSLFPSQRKEQEKKVVKNTLKSNKETKKDINLDNTENPIIPIELRVEEDIPCKNSKYFNTKHEKYILDSTSYYSKCESINNEVFDNDYVKLDTTSNLELLQQNGFYRQIESLPENDERFWNYEVSLYSKSYTGVDFRCHKDLSQTLTSDSLLEMIRMKGAFDFEQTLFGILLVFTSLLILLMIIFTVSLILMNSDIYDRMKFNKLFIILNGCFGATNVIIISILFFFHKLKFDRSDLLESHDCVDPTTVFVFSTFYTEFDSIYFKLVLLLIINIAIALYRLIYQIFFS
jgi:hypothetical protein